MSTENQLAAPGFPKFLFKTEQHFIERGRRIYYSVQGLVKPMGSGISFTARLSFPNIHEDHFTVNTLNRWGRDLFVWQAELSEGDYRRFLILTAGYIL